MRWITLLALCACSAQAFATTLTGSVTFAGSAKMNVDVGYVGWSSTHQQIEGFAGTRYGAAAPNTTQFAKRKSSVSWVSHGGFKYQFTNVPTGKYLVYARADNRLEEWKIVQVSAGTTTITTDLALQPAHTGALSLKVNKGKGRFLLLTPCAPNGTSLVPKADLMRFAIIAQLDGNSITVKTLKPGSYLISVGEGLKNGTLKKITIMAGKITACTL